MITGIDGTITIADFQQLIADKTNITPQSQEIKAGFPPRLIPFDFATRTTTPLSSLNLFDGDTLIISEATLPHHHNGNNNTTTTMVQEESSTTMADDVVNLAAMTEEEQIAMAIAASMSQQDTATGNINSIRKPTATTPVVAAAAAAKPISQSPSSSSSSKLPLPPKGSPAYHSLADGTRRAIVRRIVPDDNSCLFSAVSYVMYQTRSCAQELRKVAANAVLGEPYEFNEAVLGKESSAYAAWIQNPNSWGGAIELSIFSRHFKKEIAAFDVQTKRVDVYGEGIGYGERVMLVYDGLHYDALAVATSDGGGEGGDMTQLKVHSDNNTSNDVVLDVAMAAAGMLVERFHVHRQFTDTANFTLRCSVCKVGLIGEKEAVEHANKTGHANFEEY